MPDAIERRGDNLDLVLDVLAATVLLDQKERDQELVEFVYFGQEYGRLLRPDDILTPQQLRNWFSARKGDLAVNLAKDTDGAFKSGLLDAITDSGLRRKTLSAIYAIAICDHDFHPEEMQFVKLALEKWNLPLPKPDMFDSSLD